MRRTHARPAWVVGCLGLVASAPAWCSKMPGGEGELVVALAGAVAFVLLVLLIAIASAIWRSRRPDANPSRIWITHVVGAVVVIALAPVAIQSYWNLQSADSRARSTSQTSADDAWIATITLEPGHVSQSLDAAIPRIPKTPLAVSKLEQLAIARLQTPDLQWTSSDLDGYASIIPRVGTKYDYNWIASSVAWIRDRSNLAAVATLCDRPDLEESDRQVCRSTLRNTVKSWCAAHADPCGELARHSEYQDGQILLRTPFTHDGMVWEWMGTMELLPGDVKRSLGQAVASIPKGAPVWSDIDQLSMARLRASDARWTAADLDAFANLIPQSEPQGTFNTLLPTVAWHRERGNLSAALALCEQPALHDEDRLDCRTGLADTVREWCSGNVDSCRTLAKDSGFRDAASRLERDGNAGR
jgi:hypothetical protein